MTYPDAYDARNQKAGSDYELAMHWRGIALQEWERATAARRLHNALQSALVQLRQHPNSKLDHVADYYYRLGRESK